MINIFSNKINYLEKDKLKAKDKMKRTREKRETGRGRN
jgi:hypothetical protein